MTKSKIIDIILFNGDIDMLEFRLEELSEYIDKFVLIESSQMVNSIPYEIKYARISKWSHKIVNYTTPVSFSSTKKEEGLKKVIHKSIYDLDLNFTDIIFISKENEIPDMTLLNEIRSELSFGPIVLKSVSLNWNKTHRERFSVFGSVCILFSHIVKQDTLLEFLLRDKSNLIMPHYTKLDGGWVLKGFKKYDSDDIKYKLENKIPDENIDPISTYQLIDVGDTLSTPKKINILFNNDVGRSYINRHYFDCDYNISNPIDGEYETVNFINFSISPFENFKIDDTNGYRYFDLMVPDRVLYGTKNYDEFIYDYKINEIIKICSTVFPLDQDKIHIKINNSLVIFNWSEIKYKQ
jgi:hypothetical protein